MMVFKFGDRVRVLSTSATASHVGRAGAVAWISRTLAGTVYAYHVQLDGNLRGNRLDIGIAFSPDDLEPEAGNCPGSR